MLKRFLLAVGSIFIPITSSAAVLDFESLASGPQRTSLATAILPHDNTFSYSGFDFTSTETVYAYGPENSNNAMPRSGSTFLNIDCGCYHDWHSDSASLSITRSDSSSFSVESLRLAEGRASSYSAFGSTSVTILGLMTNGTTRSKTFTFDGISNSDGNTDFEQVSLLGFTGLSELRITAAGGENNGYSFSIDDIVVNEGLSTVPLPSSALLLLSALGFAHHLRRRR